MLILVNNLWGEQIIAFMLRKLEELSISMWNVIGVFAVMIIGIALAVSAVVKVNFNFGGFASFITTAIFGILIAIIAAKWLLFFILFGVPLMIIAFGIHRAMRRAGVDPTLRGLALWAMIILIV